MSAKWHQNRSSKSYRFKSRCVWDSVEHKVTWKLRRTSQTDDRLSGRS